VKRIFSVLLLLLILVPCRAAEPDGKISNLLADLTTKQLASIPPSTATITVTPKQAEVYEPIDVTLDADIPAESRVYGNGWTWSTGVRTLAVSATEQHVWAPPGKHTIAYSGVWVHTQTITVVDTSGTERTIESLLGIGMIDTSASFTVGEAPYPDPDPDPDPDPNPPPPPPPLPITEMWIMVVEEAQDRTPEQARVLLDPTVRRWMEKNGHHLRILDKDLTASDDQEWIDRATAQPASALPYLFVADNEGRVFFEGPLPIGPIQMLELVKKWGAEK